MKRPLVSPTDFARLGEFAARDHSENGAFAYAQHLAKLLGSDQPVPRTRARCGHRRFRRRRGFRNEVGNFSEGFDKGLT
jgi:hypothetical protein